MRLGYIWGTCQLLCDGSSLAERHRDLQGREFSARERSQEITDVRRLCDAEFPLREYPGAARDVKPDEVVLGGLDRVLESLYQR